MWGDAKITMQPDPGEVLLNNKLYEALDCLKAADTTIGTKCRIDRRQAALKHSVDGVPGANVVAKLVDNKIMWLPPLTALNSTLTPTFMRDNYGLPTPSTTHHLSRITAPLSGASSGP